MQNINKWGPITRFTEEQYRVFDGVIVEQIYTFGYKNKVSIVSTGLIDISSI